MVDECKRHSTRVQLADLSCGECKYYTLAHEKWQLFVKEGNDFIPLAQLFQEIQTDYSAVGGSQNNVESKVKELKSQRVRDDGIIETTLPSVRLVVNRDEFEESNALAEKQVKGVSGENLSDKRISLSSFSAEEMTEAQKQDGNLDHQRVYLASGAERS